MTIGLPGQVAGALALLCGLGLLRSRTIDGQRAAARWQCVFVAAACGWTAWAQSAPVMLLVGLVAIAAAYATTRSGGLGDCTARRHTMRPGSLTAGLALAGIGIVAVLPNAEAARSMGREAVAVAMAVVLLGMLAAAMRRDRAATLIAIGNGALLGVAGLARTPGNPGLVLLLAFGAVLPLACMLPADGLPATLLPARWRIGGAR